MAGGQQSSSAGGIPPNLLRGTNVNNSTVNDIPPNTTYSKFSASLAASHAQAVSSSGGNSREADRELSRNDVAFRKVCLFPFILSLTQKLQARDFAYGHLGDVRTILNLSYSFL